MILDLCSPSGIFPSGLNFASSESNLGIMFLWLVPGYPRVVEPFGCSERVER